MRGVLRGLRRRPPRDALRPRHRGDRRGGRPPGSRSRAPRCRTTTRPSAICSPRSCVSTSRGCPHEARHLERELGPPAAGAAARAAGTTRARRRVPAGDQGRGRRLPDDGGVGRRLRDRAPSASARTTASRSCPASGLEDTRTGFDGDPVPEQSRVVAARAGGVDVVCVYVVNGKEVGDPAYETKLAWLEALRAWLDATRDPAKPLIVAGDFNIAPDDRDVWDPACGRARTSPATPSGSACARLMDWGLDRPRTCRPRATSRPVRLLGLPGRGVPQRVGAPDRSRAGHPPIAKRLQEVVVERDERKPTFGEGKPSDHAPVIVTLT